MKKSVKDIAGLINGEVVGDTSTQIHSLGSIETAKEGEIAFAFSKEHLQRLEETLASCVVVPKDFGFPSKKTLIKTPNPKEAFIYLLNFFYKPERRRPEIHKQAVVSSNAVLGKDVYLGPHAVIEEGAAIGDNSTIEAGVYVGKGTKIGKDTLIYPNVTI